MPEHSADYRRYLALDLGEARIGLAVSDPTGTLCTPLEAIRRSGPVDDFRRVLERAGELDVAGIIIGLPVTMEGRRGTMAASAMRFRESLRSLTDLPVTLVDERLSTVEATSRMRAAGHTSRDDKGLVDSASAAVILEAYLASHHRPARNHARDDTPRPAAPRAIPRRRRTGPGDGAAEPRRDPRPPDVRDRTADWYEE
jgi:putative Holliday junction resolvase